MFVRVELQEVVADDTETGTLQKPPQILVCFDHVGQLENVFVFAVTLGGVVFLQGIQQITFSGGRFQNRADRSVAVETGEHLSCQPRRRWIKFCVRISGQVFYVGAGRRVPAVLFQRADEVLLCLSDRVCGWHRESIGAISKSVIICCPAIGAVYLLDAADFLAAFIDSYTALTPIRLFLLKDQTEKFLFHVLASFRVDFPVYILMMYICGERRG